MTDKSQPDAGSSAPQPESSVRKEEAVSPAPAATRSEPSEDAAAAPAPQPVAVELPREPEPQRAGRAVSRGDMKRITRRELLKMAPLVLAGAFVIPTTQRWLLERGVRASDAASGLLFGRRRLAPIFADSMVVPFERFPYNGYDVLDPSVDLDNWTLTVEGEVRKPGEYTLEQVQSLPKVTQNTRHVCVEGWDAIGNFGGTRVSDFLALVGADTSARFLEVECADDYYESIDMASALHPQSLLCYQMYGKPLDRGHGAPLRLQLPTKLGYKQAKYLTALKVSNVLGPQRGYWEDQGYSWHAGL